MTDETAYYQDALAIMDRVLVGRPDASQICRIKQIRIDGPHNGLREAKTAVESARERGHLLRAADGILTITTRGRGYLIGLGDTLTCPAPRGGLTELLHTPRR